MGNAILFIVILIVIFAFMGIERGGIDELKEKPISSVIDSSKTIWDAGKDIYTDVREMRGNETDGT